MISVHGNSDQHLVNNTSVVVSKGAKVSGMASLLRQVFSPEQAVCYLNGPFARHAYYGNGPDTRRCGQRSNGF